MLRNGLDYRTPSGQLAYQDIKQKKQIWPNVFTKNIRGKKLSIMQLAINHRDIMMTFVRSTISDVLIVE